MTPRIGLIGCGRWGRLILRDLLKLGCEVEVTCRSEATAAFARGSGARAAGTALPEPAAVDAYVVATPAATHAAVLGTIVAAGKPIFVEKPMTTDSGSAQRLAALAPERLFVMDKWRHHPGVEAMRQEVAAGKLGRVLAIRASRWQWSSPHRDVTPLWVLTPHDLAITLHVLGRLPPLAQAFAVVPGRPELGFVAVLQDAETQVIVEAGIVETGHRRRCLVVGQLGTLELTDAYDAGLQVRRGAPGEPAAEALVLPISTEMPLEAELRAFLAHLRGEGPPPCSSAADGALVVARLAEIEAALGLPPSVA
ncbi:Gfo/Idh/MocA family oxidoreductase [Phenylobacterium sp. LjRoot219]|uniref:Gfo/Idh/MocA family protein n=1 Tax=Phenylobacterium sp. LjRoot219 TaxID=3342283 RepID=UPI003ECE13BC